MTILARLCLILGAAFIGYGIAVASIVPDIMSKQDAAFQRFITAHTAEINSSFSQPTNTPTKQDFYRLKMRVMLSGGLYPGWAQAIMPSSFGLMFIAVSYYFSQKKRRRMLDMTHRPNIRRSSPPLALAVPQPRSTSRIGSCSPHGR